MFYRFYKNHPRYAALPPLLILLVLCVSFFGVRGVLAAADTTTREIVVQVPIRGLTSPCTLPANSGKECVKSLGDYLGILYRFLAGVIGIIATLMVLWGGIKWVTASGNTGRISDAKDTIYSAIIAIILTLGSYILLYTINPQLVSLTLPSVYNVTPIELSSVVCNENPRSAVTFKETATGKTCNPDSNDPKDTCCGKELTVSMSGNTDPCQWLACPGKDEVCRTKDTNPNNTSIYNCVKVNELCVVENNGSDECAMVDLQLQQQKTSDQVQKFQNTGCAAASNGTCRWDALLSSYTTASQLMTDWPAGYEPIFVNCFLAGAEDVCWEKKDGKPVAKKCSSWSSQRCAIPGDAPRPIAGIAGGCLVKVGQIGSMNKDDYKCWNPSNHTPSNLTSLLPQL